MRGGEPVGEGDGALGVDGGLSGFGSGASGRMGEYSDAVRRRRGRRRLRRRKWARWVTANCLSIPSSDSWKLWSPRPAVHTTYSTGQ